MPEYMATIRDLGERKQIRIFQSTSSDAEKEIRKQFPNCEILNINRNGSATYSPRAINL